MLTRLLQDRSLRETVAAQAYQYVRTSRCEADHAVARRDLYRQLGAEDEGAAIPNLPLQVVEEGTRAFEVADHPAETALVAGIQLESQGKGASARNRFRRAMQLRPGYGLPAFWLGSSHQRGEELSQAEKAFERAASADKRSLRSLLALARLQARRDPEQAAETFARAVALAPEHAGVYVALGELAERRGDARGAADHFARALEHNAHSAPAAAGLARASIALADPVAARTALERVVTLSPQDSAAHHRLAEWLYTQGDLLRAAERCVRAVELDARNESARALMRRLLAATAGM